MEFSISVNIPNVNIPTDVTWVNPSDEELAHVQECIRNPTQRWADIKLTRTSEPGPSFDKYEVCAQLKQAKHALYPCEYVLYHYHEQQEWILYTPDAMSGIYARTAKSFELLSVRGNPHRELHSKEYVKHYLTMFVELVVKAEDLVLHASHKKVVIMPKETRWSL